jgi:23S rRNA pseudouridine2605 synthase
MKKRYRKRSNLNIFDSDSDTIKAKSPEYQFFRKSKNQNVKNAPNEIRLNKYIANSGICSRREADKLIENGEIKVNGKVIQELGYKVKTSDKIFYKGKKLKREKFIYILLNKPKDFITTTDDPHNRKTVIDLVKKHIGERVYPVGRLDRNTTGLLLITNDGELSEILAHPSYNIRKVYEVHLDKPLREKDLESIEAGLELEDGPVKIDDFAVISPDKRIIGVEIHSGRNRIVRRIFEKLGYTVVQLDRVMYSFLTKKDLPRGKWRFLKEYEVVKLKHLGKGRTNRSGKKD